MNMNVHGLDGNPPKIDHHDEDDDVPLPGFRFHPTDEELLRFYLRRKVDKKPIKIELIKQIDIYKYDPWDLPKPSSEGEDSYFFCKRGRKYRNSIRPNRVTGSGFWKATGIDKPVFSHGGEGHQCLGLKKTLVYYRGSAGKGTKTDWMMHEFRLPSDDATTNHNSLSNIKEAAEVWTICRIFKRNMSHKKYTANWREIAAAKRHPPCTITSSITCSYDSNNDENYINFGDPDVQHYDDDDEKHVVNQIDGRSQWHAVGQVSTIGQVQAQPPPLNIIAPSPSFPDQEDDFFTKANWDELRSVVEFGLDPFV